ncbi:hypothetical protein Tco_0076826 [Tanacetum coccineum]
MLSQLLRRIHRNKARIQLMVNLWVAPSSCLGQHLNFKGTDISIITRKQSKTGKHEHEKRKSTKEARDAKPKPRKVKKSKL